MSKRSQNFSISQDYEEIWDILDNVENKSKFICEAIISYSKQLDNQDNGPDKEEIRTIVKEILDEMMSDNIFLIKGSPENLPKTINDFINEDKDKIKEELKEELNIENNQEIKKNEDKIEKKEEDISDILKELTNDSGAKNAALGMLGF